MSMHAAFDRWWNGISLRAKITGVTVLLLTFGLTVAGAGTMTVLARKYEMVTTWTTPPGVNNISQPCRAIERIAINPIPPAAVTATRHVTHAPICGSTSPTLNCSFRPHSGQRWASRPRSM